MLLLSLDTSAGASAALTDSTTGTVLGRWATPDTRHHAEQLTPAIADLLARAGREDDTAQDDDAPDDVVDAARPDAVVVGTGPGPFTGLRAGIMTARALAFAWDVPCWGVSSLHALARQAADAGASGDFLVATDARRRELYWAHARASASGVVLVDGPHVGAAETLPALDVHGAGAGLYPDRLAGTPQHTGLLPDATAVGAVALAALRLTPDPVAAGLTDTSPRYLRESDARVPAAPKAALR